MNFFSSFTRSPRGLVGLKNIGNTCYMNSAIQCLAATPKLSEFFLDGSYKTDLNVENRIGSQGIFAKEYEVLMRALWRPSSSTYTPRQIKKLMDQYAPQFVGNNQHDSQEFLSFLLDLLHEDLNRVTARPRYIEEPDINRKTAKLKTQEHFAAAAWCRHLLRNKSFLVDTFQGQLRSKISCLRCGEFSVKFEPFLYLSLPLTSRSHGERLNTLDAALTEFMKDEYLTGEDRWRCPNCKNFVDAKKKMKMWKLPAVLIVHFKRFRHTHGRIQKIVGTIEVPSGHYDHFRHVVDLSDYTSQQQKDGSTYNVYAVINHTGIAEFGHYTANCWHRENNKWYLFDDDSVTEVSCSQAFSRDKYVMFLERVDTELIRRQTMSRPEDWPHFLRATSINEILRDTVEEEGFKSPS
eukprot:Lankesteria_metandrocarpae@DN3460_c0_g1_i1.p1